jgi:hypothetical protein
MPIRRTTSVSRNVRPAIELSPDLLEEACDAVVFLAGYPVRLTRTKLVNRAPGGAVSLVDGSAPRWPGLPCSSRES